MSEMKLQCQKVKKHIFVLKEKFYGSLDHISITMEFHLDLPIMAAGTAMATTIQMIKAIVPSETKKFS